MDKRLLGLGFSERVIQEASLYPDFFLGRVVSQYRYLYKVATEKSEEFSEISGNYSEEDRPVPISNTVVKFFSAKYHP